MEGVLDRDRFVSAGGLGLVFAISDTFWSGFVSCEKLTAVDSILLGVSAVFLDEKGSSIFVEMEKSEFMIHFYIVACLLDLQMIVEGKNLGMGPKGGGLHIPDIQRF